MASLFIGMTIAINCSLYPVLSFLLPKVKTATHHIISKPQIQVGCNVLESHQQKPSVFC